MRERLLRIVGIVAALAVLLIVGALNAPPKASAAPPPPCPSPLGAPGGVLYHVFATLPVGVPAASAVCVQLPGFPVLNSGAVTQAPAGCPSPPPIEGAGGTAAAGWVWADWGVACVPPGGTVVLEFRGPAGLTLGRVPMAATWNIGIMTDATVWPAACPASPPGVGGVPLWASEIAPVGGPYDGACMSLVAPVPGVHSPSVIVSPPLCPAGGAAIGAAVLQVWDDFTVKCANAGDLLVMGFIGPTALIGPCASCVTWLDGAVIGNATVTVAGFLNPGAGRPCIQDHKDDTNGDGYSNADQMTPSGMPTCAGAFPPTGGLGTDPLAPCPGRNLGGTPAQMAAATKARADVDLDGQVTIIDLSIVAGHFLESANPADVTDVHWEFDQDGDGQMTIIDLSIMAGIFLQSVPPC